MKYLKYFTITTLIILIIVLTVNVTKKTKEEFNEIQKNTISFSLKYGIKLENEDIMPKPIEVNRTILLSELIKINDLKVSFYFFNYKDQIVQGGEQVDLVPKDEVKTIRINYRTVNEQYFTSKNITKSIANKTIDVFKKSINFQDAYFQLEKEYRKYKAYNYEFYTEAFKKLLF